MGSMEQPELVKISTFDWRANLRLDRSDERVMRSQMTGKDKTIAASKSWEQHWPEIKNVRL
jgi:hypothetical protein